MVTIHAVSGRTLALGREGENLARQIVFDISGWRESYGNGTISLIAKQHGDTDPYPCNITVDGDAVTWPITSADTACPDYGRCELRYTVGDVLVKSEMWRTFVADALGTPLPEPPEPQKAWVDKVLAAGQAAVDATETAKNAAEQAAENAAKTALDAAGTAEDRTDADSARQQAVSAAEAAAGSAQAAEKSAGAAENAREKAETAAIRQPKADESTGTWWVWDADAEEYVDTGVKAVAEAPPALRIINMEELGINLIGMIILNKSDATFDGIGLFEQFDDCITNNQIPVLSAPDLEGAHIFVSAFNLNENGKTYIIWCTLSAYIQGYVNIQLQITKFDSTTGVHLIIQKIE